MRIRLPGVIYRLLIFTKNCWFDEHTLDGAKSSGQDVVIQHEDKRMVSTS
jgi:hypothetical protein